MRTFFFLLASNVFMTAAWYGHLRFKGVALWKVVLVSWGIAFFEYCLQVPGQSLGVRPIQRLPAQAHPGGHHADRLRGLLGDVAGRGAALEPPGGFRAHSSPRLGLPFCLGRVRQQFAEDSRV
jgi:hypothetical protein